MSHSTFLLPTDNNDFPVGWLRLAEKQQNPWNFGETRHALQYYDLA